MTSFHRKGIYVLSAKLRKVRLDFKARSVWSQGPRAHTSYSMLPSNIPLDNTQRGSSPNPMRFSDIKPNEGRADPSEETKKQMASFCHSKRRNHRKVEAHGWHVERSCNKFLSEPSIYKDRSKGPMAGPRKHPEPPVTPPYSRSWS